MNRDEIRKAEADGAALLLSRDRAWAGPRSWDPPRKVRPMYVPASGRKTHVEYLDDRPEGSEPWQPAKGGHGMVLNASLRGRWDDLALQIEQARHARLAEESEKQHRKDVEASAQEILARHGLPFDPATRRLGITIDADTLAEVLSFYDLAHDERFDRQDGKET
jgi:hypothetical protein